MSPAAVSTARRLREREAREQHILDAAQALIQQDGLLNLQMARLAEASEVATGTLYQHFASKEDLLVTLSARNCAARRGLFEQAAGWSGPSRERMLAIGIADTLMLAEQPEFFRLAQYALTEVVWGAASPQRRAQALAASEPLGGLVMGIIRDARVAGDLPLGTSLTEAELCLGPWTLCLGMHTLVHAEGMLRDKVQAPYRLMFHHLQMLLNGYGWQPLFDPAHEDLDALLCRLSRQIFDRDAPPLAAPAF